MCAVVLITGGSQGIGQALVQQYLAAGDQVVTCARHMAQLPHQPRLLTLTCDLNDQSASRALVAQVVAQFGRIDCLIVNHGICRDRTFLKMTQDDWQQVLQTNLLSVFGLTQAVFQQMAQQTGWQQIYLMTSANGITGAIGQTNYAASKAGLLGFMKALALEGQQVQVTVNAIAPAAVTAMTAPVIAKLQQRGPLPPAWQLGTPQALAATFWHLTQLRPRLTGQCFAINGQQLSRYLPPERETLNV
ncbi:SDR family NAD(P)-dependent oxidoreductase [Loigolactobacillus bifermentans]|uniref:Ketoreductase domain-containing protein n=1 Tax=Loigolactobacillus bifermentans DSM 20003 TaxID=1423726 RepID=A0A0R1GY93_9LACO|nr:SDR family NAD(P)-dependent oxidoreductase [Loigolactobacillus bifermentans]KRK39087.1 hypothetical protein FC07_GL002807 [Loigolactobacillus bifermentans DSM 20003]QGG59025.1 SDR family NAD(P)-dependent oxidoreductase [Loigolactobacillus bifermentans]